MLSKIVRFPCLDQSPSRHADPEEIDRARTRRLVAKLFRIVRPTLAIRPPRRENICIALDAVAWATAMILTNTEDRNALDFFTLALIRNLNRLEVRKSDGHAAEVTGPVQPGASLGPRPARVRTEPRHKRESRAKPRRQQPIPQPSSPLDAPQGEPADFSLNDELAEDGWCSSEGRRQSQP